MARRKNTTMKAGFMTSLPAKSFAGQSLANSALSAAFEESKITTKGQLTLPKAVRTVLGVDSGDSVRFVMEDDRIVVESAAKEQPDDPALVAFLDLIEGSINKASGFPVEMMEAMKALTSDIKVDLDAPIDGDVVI